MKKIVSLLIAFVVLLGSVQVFAGTRPTAAEFPEKTIIIGTHAVALNSLNKEILEIAQKSADDSSQDKIYFKSDINKGTWYDITDSTNINQISVTTNNIVSNETINQLPLTHYTNEKGETIEFSSGNIISLSAIDDCTNPNNIAEMDTIKNEREILASLDKNDAVEKDDKDTHNAKVSSIDRVMKIIEGYSVTNANNKIKGMESLVKNLQSDSSVTSDMVALAVDEKVNAENEKKAICYQTLIDRMNAENKKLNYQTCNDLIQKYGDAITALQGKISELGVDEKVLNSSENQNGTGENSGENGNTGTGGNIGENGNSGTGENAGENGSTGNGQASSSVGDNGYINSENVNDNILNQGQQEIQKDIFTSAIDKACDDMVNAAMNGNIDGAKSSLKKASALKSSSDNNMNVSDEVKSLQLSALESVKNDAKSAFNESVKNLTDNDEYKNALTDGSSDATIEKIKSDLAEEIADNLAQIMDIDKKVNQRQSSFSKKDSNLNSTKALAESAIASASDEFKQAISNALASKISEINDEISENKLNSLPEYETVKKTVDELKNSVHNLNEKYISAIEEGSGNADSLKDSLQKAADALFDAEDKMINLENGVKDGSIAVAVSDNGGKVSSGNNPLSQKDSQNASSGAGSSNNAGQGQASSNGSNQGSASVNSGANGVALGDSGESAELINQKNKYTQAEQNQLQKAANAGGKAYDVPWKLVFKDRNIKLNSPIMVNSNKIYVPAQELATKLNLQVVKNKIDSNCFIIKGGRGLIEFTIGKAEVYVNDKRYNYKPTPLRGYGGKIYIPLECFEKAFGLKEVQNDDCTIVVG